MFFNYQRKRWVFLFSFLFLVFFFISCKGFEGKKVIKGNGEIYCPDAFEPVRVVKVLDGDTVVLENGEKLRYAGINALELHTESGIPEPFAKEAYERNRELTEGKVLCFERALRERDRYGRLLGDLYYPNGTSVSEILVSEGLAFVCYYEGSGNYYQKLLPLQRKALKARKNLFSYVDKPQGKINYLGNKKSRRFHHPECSSSKGIKGKIIFKNLEEAFWEGYCPSRECTYLIFPH